MEPLVSCIGQAKNCTFYLLLDKTCFRVAGSEDYGSTTQVLEFGVSTTRQLVEIPILNNEETEDTEQFFAQLTLVHSDADVQLVQDRATIVIVDDDGMITYNYTFVPK